MAGGKGSRLKPLTNIIPKPLIPVGDKTFIEEIMSSFIDYGCSDFFITVNYKEDLIKYINEGQKPKIKQIIISMIEIIDSIRYIA